jgi:DNA-binding MarR family transcriptional regulator
MIQDKELLDKILESLSKIIFIEKKRILIFDDIKLYPSEIHLLLFIYFEQDTNITEIANKINLTKGAVSQTLSMSIK